MKPDWHTLIQKTVDECFEQAVHDWTAFRDSDEDRERVRKQTIQLMAAVCGIDYRRFLMIADGADILEDEEFEIAVAACAYTSIKVCIECNVPREWISNWNGKVGPALLASLQGPALSVPLEGGIDGN